MSGYVEWLAAHVDTIAAVNGIDVRPKSRGGRAWRRERAIAIPPIRSERGYFTALHELGHVLGPQSRHRLDKEGEAWEWALDNAEVEPSPATARMMYACLTGYLAWAVGKQMRGGNVRVPEPDAPFWDTLDRLAVLGAVDFRKHERPRRTA